MKSQSSKEYDARNYIKITISITKAEYEKLKELRKHDIPTATLLRKAINTEYNKI